MRYNRDIHFLAASGSSVHAFWTRVDGTLYFYNELVNGVPWLGANSRDKLRRPSQQARHCGREAETNAEAISGCLKPTRRSGGRA